jgi:hypothetical protein
MPMWNCKLSFQHIIVHIKKVYKLVRIKYYRKQYSFLWRLVDVTYFREKK